MLDRKLAHSRGGHDRPGRRTHAVAQLEPVRRQGGDPAPRRERHPAAGIPEASSIAAVSTRPTGSTSRTSRAAHRGEWVSGRRCRRGRHYRLLLALALADAGLRVRPYEAREIAGGASGRNGGFALRGGAAPDPVMVDSIGRERAAALWRWTEDELRELAAVASYAFAPPGAFASPRTMRNGRSSKRSTRLSSRWLRWNGATSWRSRLRGGTRRRSSTRRTVSSNPRARSKDRCARRGRRRRDPRARADRIRRGDRGRDRRRRDRRLSERSPRGARRPRRPDAGAGDRDRAYP